MMQSAPNVAQRLKFLSSQLKENQSFAVTATPRESQSDSNCLVFSNNGEFIFHFFSFSRGE
jgi:hypothetical protein